MSPSFYPVCRFAYYVSLRINLRHKSFTIEESVLVIVMEVNPYCLHDPDEKSPETVYNALKHVIVHISWRPYAPL